MKQIKNLNRGFTLAEVLITLGIIGVVAAITIPTLIANINGQRYRSQFKKTLSTLNQAGRMAQAQYDFDFGAVEVQCTNGASDNPETDKTICAILNGTLSGITYYSNVSNIKDKNGEYPYDYHNYISGVVEGSLFSGFSYYGKAYQLSDGSIFVFDDSPANSDAVNHGAPYPKCGIDSRWKCKGFIDVNGTSLPNKVVTCSNVDMGGDPYKKDDSCVVKNDAQHMTDIYPVYFYGNTVEPASSAAKYVLNSAK
ncbi:type II secretion system protein [bacterium]|nr:type II secretion system protein [bacterium]